MLLILVQRTTEQKEPYALCLYSVIQPKLNFNFIWLEGMYEVRMEEIKVCYAHESIVLSICPFQPSILSTGVLFTYDRAKAITRYVLLSVDMWWELGPWCMDMLLIIYVVSCL